MPVKTFKLIAMHPDKNCGKLYAAILFNTLWGVIAERSET